MAMNCIGHVVTGSNNTTLPLTQRSHERKHTCLRGQIVNVGKTCYVIDKKN